MGVQLTPPTTNAMKRRYFLTLSSMFAAMLPLVSPAAAGDFPKGSPAFKTGYAEALKVAKDEAKPLVLVFSATWCPPCQANKAKVYPSDAVKPYHDKFVWAYLDTDIEANGEVAKKFGVSGIPHIQFLTKAGKSIDKSIGGTTPDAFAGKLKEVLAAAK